MAQTCLGLGSFSTGSIQVTGAGSFTDGANTLGAGVGYGTGGAFGSGVVGTSSIEAFDGSSLDLGVILGYQIRLQRTAQLQLCPVVGLGVGIGPNNSFGSGVERSSRMASVGLAVGTSLPGGGGIQIAPTAAVSYAYGQSKAENSAGTTLFEISDHYCLAQLGVGFVFNNLSVRPRVDLPLGFDGSEPTVGLTVGYNFGRKR